jgi:hypothetical protein
MLRDDYMLRLAEQVGSAIAAGLAEGGPGTTSGMSDDLAALCRQHVGIDLTIVLGLSPDGLRDVLAQSGPASVPKSAALAEILLAQGRLAELRGDRSVVVPCHVHAFHLLRTCGPAVRAADIAVHEAKITATADRLRELGLSAYVAQETGRRPEADRDPGPSNP